MLDIAESVPLQESTAPISELDQTRTPSDSGIDSTNSQEFFAIPETRELYPISEFITGIGSSLDRKGIIE